MRDAEEFERPPCIHGECCLRLQEEIGYLRKGGWCGRYDVWLRHDHKGCPEEWRRCAACRRQWDRGEGKE